MGIIETIKMLAKEEGLEKGLEEGFEKGMEKGREEGLEKEKIIIKNLLINSDFDVNKISNLTGVSEDFVQSVKNELNSNG